MSNLMILGGGPLTMSSYEIAELLQTRHDSVKRSIERCVNRGAITPPPLVEVQNPGPGPLTMEVYSLGKRDSLVVVAQLSPEFTAAVVDRWQELESSQATALPNFASPADAARAWAIEYEEKQKAQQALALAAPKVEFVDRFVLASEGSKGFREVCKLLKANEAEFRCFVIDRRIMYRLAGKLTAHQNHIDAGRFEVKAGIADNDHAYTTTKFTAKGVEWIAGEWAKHKVGVTLLEAA